MVTIVNNKNNFDPIEFNSLKSYLKLIPRANFGKININFKDKIVVNIHNISRPEACSLLIVKIFFNTKCINNGDKAIIVKAKKLKKYLILLGDKNSFKNTILDLFNISSWTQTPIALEIIIVKIKKNKIVKLVAISLEIK